MDKDTIIASLKNDLSKLEKQIHKLNADLVVQHQEITTHDLMKKAYEKEHNRKYEELKQTFYEFMDIYFKLKYRFFCECYIIYLHVVAKLI